MTEILGSDDRAGRPVSLPPQPGGDVPVELLDGCDADSDLDGEPLDEEPRRWHLLLGALGEPGSRAVAAVLFLLAGVVIGPSYRFDTYPFNQGLGSLQTAFNSSTIRPLHDFLTAAAPSIALTLACVVAAALAVLRGRADDPSWVRPVAAGALLVGVVVLVLFGLGAYRTSTYDLRQPTAEQSQVGSS